MLKRKKVQKLSYKSLPKKRSINLAAVGENKIKISRLVIGVIVVLIAAGLIGKFAVYDRYAKLYEKQSEVAVLQQQVDYGYQRIASFGDLSDEYAHYTYAGMTAEELDLADRVDILAMIQEDVLSELYLNSWSISGNRLELNVSGSTLQQINLIAKSLQENETMVDYTTVNTASTNNSSSSRGDVTATITVFLNGPREEAALK